MCACRQAYLYVSIDTYIHMQTHLGRYTKYMCMSYLLAYLDLEEVPLKNLRLLTSAKHGFERNCELSNRPSPHPRPQVARRLDAESLRDWREV